MDVSAKDIDRWHRERGWLGIGYHFVIKRDGTLEKGRHISASGAHAKGYNNRSIGICLVGGVAEDKKTPENNFTEAQMLSLKCLLMKLTEDFPQAEVIGHRDVNPHKACPSFNARAWWKDIKST